MNVLGRDQLDPKAADYSAILTKIKSLNADSLYYGGVSTAAVKLIKQSYDILPNLKKGGGDGIVTSDVLSGAGFPACAGWYATQASPHLVDDSKLSSWIAEFKKKYSGEAPEDYSITSYDAASVIIQAMAKLAASGKAVTAGRGARGNPDRQVQYAAGPGGVRREWRHREQGDQRLPDHQGRQLAARRRERAVQIHWRGADELRAA